jgi:precorrin-2/cobalt-factor-2 C20-methyltransferase
MDMTLRAKQTLEQADVIVAPVKQAGGTSTAYEIAAQGADLRHAEMLPMVFPMKQTHDYRTYLRQSGAVETITKRLDAGKNVAMVSLGDVSVYSTATYVRDMLEEAGYATQVVAGIPSFCSGAARAGKSLCENGQSLLIMPGITSPERLEQALTESDNLVIMKAGRTLPWLLPKLEEKGLLAQTTMLQNVGMAQEYIGAPVAGGNSYFTTLLIQKKRR